MSEVKKYRKKISEIEAIQLNEDNPKVVRDFVRETAGENACWIKYYDNKHSEVAIVIPVGVLTARVGDWVIKDVQGEFYLCKPGIFEEAYEEVGEPSKEEEERKPQLGVRLYHNGKQFIRIDKCSDCGHSDYSIEDEAWVCRLRRGGVVVLKLAESPGDFRDVLIPSHCRLQPAL